MSNSYSRDIFMALSDSYDPDLEGEVIARKFKNKNTESLRVINREKKVLETELQDEGIGAFENALKALCLIEETSPCGSTTAIPALSELYAKRWPERGTSMCRWLKDHSTNPYVPFGTARWSHAESWEHLDELLSAHKVKRAHLEDVRKEYKEFRKSVTRDLRASRATKNLPSALKRGDLNACKALIDAGADIHAIQGEVGSLQKIAFEMGREDIVMFLRSKDIQ